MIVITNAANGVNTNVMSVESTCGANVQPVGIAMDTTTVGADGIRTNR
jgi:hypothetical protein